MEQRYLIDSNIISHLFSDRLPDTGKEFVTNVINSEFLISVITEIEVLTYHEIPEKMDLIEEFIKLAIVIPLDKVVTKRTIELRRKHRKFKLGDAIIASTALIDNLTLITNNVRDFSNVKGLKIIDPHKV